MYKVLPWKNNLCRFTILSFSFFFSFIISSSPSPENIIYHIITSYNWEGKKSINFSKPIDNTKKEDLGQHLGINSIHIKCCCVCLFVWLNIRFPHHKSNYSYSNICFSKRWLIAAHHSRPHITCAAASAALLGNQTSSIYKDHQQNV